MVNVIDHSQRHLTSSKSCANPQKAQKGVVRPICLSLCTILVPHALFQGLMKVLTHLFTISTNHRQHILSRQFAADIATFEQAIR